MTAKNKWVLMMLAGAAIVSVSLGTRSVFGLFLTPISNELGTGLQLFSLAIALQNIVWGLASPLFGALADRIGAWKVAALGGIIYTAGLLSTALMVNEAGIFLGQFLIGLGMGSAGLSVALGAVARAAPPEKRSIAMGLVTSFGSFGQFALLPLTQIWISGFGWQGAMLILSLLMAVSIAFALGLRGDNTAQTSDVAAITAGEALKIAAKSRDYILLTTGFFVCGLQLVFITTHLPPFLEQSGLSPNIASWSLAVVGLFNIAGAFILGWLGGIRSKRKTLATVYLLRSVIIVLFVMTPITPMTALIFGAAMGLLWLGTIPLTSGLIVVFFGPKHLSMLFGIAFLSHQIGSFLGAWLGGLIYDLTGDYMLMWGLNAAAGLLAFAVNWMITEDRPKPSRAPA